MATLAPTLTQLEYALAVHRQGSFGAAARACHVSQPALSAQVAKLERLLGVALFDRRARPVIATDIGETLLPRFAEVVGAVHEIEAIAGARARGPLRGPFRLGIIPTLAPYLLPRFVAAFARAHPEVDLRIRELETDAITADLQTDDLDAGVLATPLAVAGVHERRLFDEPMRIYASAGSSLTTGRRRRFEPSQLPVDELVVMTEGHCLRTQVLDVCALRRGAAPPTGFRLETGSMTTLVRMLDEGPWFTVLPELALDELDADVRSDRVFDFVGPLPYREISLVFRRRTHRADVRRALGDAIEASVPAKWRRRSRSPRRLPPVGD